MRQATVKTAACWTIEEDLMKIQWAGSNFSLNNIKWYKKLSEESKLADMVNVTPGV